MAKRGAEGWKVLVVDDDQLRRQGLEALCGNVAEIGEVAVAAGPGEAIALLDVTDPDVVIVDLAAQPHARVAELGRLARSKGASTLLVTAGQDPSLLAEAMEWASGFLPRQASPTAVAYAVQVVRSGHFYMESDRALRGMVEELDALREVSDRGSGSESLTPREKEVLRLLSEGLSARQMARRLELSERTINTHVANVYRKLAVSNRVQAVRRAIRLGLVTEPG